MCKIYAGGEEVIIYFLLASILSGLLYRAGGMSKDETAQPTWMPIWLRESYVRDLGVSTLGTLSLYLMFGFTWWLILSWGLLYAAISTYNKWLEKKPWLQWIVTGASYGLAALPFAISVHHIPGCIIRTIFLAGAIAWLRMWNKPIGKWSSDIVVEFGCGFLISISLLLL